MAKVTVDDILGNVLLHSHLLTNDLKDVVIVAPADNEALMFDSLSGKWKNQGIPAGITSHAALSNLDYASAAHTGFEPTLTKGNLTESTSSVLTIGSGTNAVIGAGTTIQVTKADASNSGYLDKTDWSTFNNKQNTITTGNLTELTSAILTIGSGTGAVIGSGTTITVTKADVSHDGYLSQGDWSTFNSKEPAVTKGNLTEATSSILTITGGTNAVIGSGTSIQVTKADGTHNGYLDKTDWSSFTNHVASTSNPHSTSDANLVVTDIATNNASTLAHGFLQKLPGSASQFLNGAGNFITIPASASAPPGFSETTFSGQTSVNVVHNFGFKPLVQVLDASGSPLVMIPLTITHNSDNDFTVTFSVSSSGTILASVGSPPMPNVTSTSINYTVLTNDNIVIANAFNITLTLPTAVGKTGKTYTLDNNSTGDVFVTGTGGELIQGLLTQTLPTQSSYVLYSTGASWRAS